MSALSRNLSVIPTNEYQDSPQILKSNHKAKSLIQNDSLLYNSQQKSKSSLKSFDFFNEGFSPRDYNMNKQKSKIYESVLNVSSFSVDSNLKYTY